MNKQAKNKLYLISGYWKDDKSEFNNYLVSEFHDVPEGHKDDDIFYFGLSESNIKEAIKEKENNSLDFVITSYKPY